MDDLKRKIEKYGATAIVARQQKGIHSTKILESNAGGEFWGKEDENWPYFDDVPLLPVLAVKTDKLPYLPNSLKDIALLNVFVAGKQSLLDEKKGSVVIRTYKTLDNLQALDKPKSIETPCIKLEWETITDYPNFDQLSCNRLSKEELKQYLEVGDAIEAEHINHSGIKIAGWPTLIQETYFLKVGNPEFVLQIDCTDVFMYCDSGIGYLMNSGGRWYTHWETM